MLWLQNLVSDALYEAAEFEDMDADGDEALVALSPDRTTAYATFAGRWEDPDFEPGEDWYIFHGRMEEILDEVGGLFDLR